MAHERRTEDSTEMKERSVERALQGYRERRRIRRSDDTYFGGASALRAAAEEGVPVDELDSRRASIMEEAEAEQMPSELAELLYDIAREEGLDPAIGFELDRTGLGVAPPADGLATSSEQPATDRYLPAWMFPATPPDQVLRERMLRTSFRRLRSFLEKEDDLDAALKKFAREPDVGHYGY